MVKKLICAMLTVVFILSCCACSKKTASSSKTSSDNGGTICKTNYTVLNACFVDFKKKQSDYKFDMNKVFCAQTELNNFYNNVIKKNYLIDKVRIKKQFGNYSEKWFDSHVLSHTCPLKYELVEALLNNIDQSTVDKSTEEWLNTIEQKLQYDRWYCGHYHVTKVIDKMVFMFNDFRAFSLDR